MIVGVVNAVEWMPVESGRFSSAAYRASVRQLYLRFQDDKIYRFFDCPVAVYNEFVEVASKGRYFSQQIRNRFLYEMIRRCSFRQSALCASGAVLGGAPERFYSAGQSPCSSAA